VRARLRNWMPEYTEPPQAAADTNAAAR
jgi:hypothetical protein